MKELSKLEVESSIMDFLHKRGLDHGEAKRYFDGLEEKLTARQKSEKYGTIQEYLKQLGFSESEAEIYLYLLEERKAYTSDIASKTSLSRSTVTSSAARLVKAGLIEKIQEKKALYYRIRSSHILLEQVNEQLEKYRHLKEFYDTFSNYLFFFDSERIPTRVLFYNDIDGIKQMLWNELKAKTELLLFSYRPLYEVTGWEFFVKVLTEYGKRKIKCKEIRSSKDVEAIVSSATFKKGKKKFPKFDMDSRMLSEEILHIPLQIDIYNDVVAIFNWHKGDVFGVEIYNPKVADFLRQVHATYWKMTKKYTT